MAARTAAPSEAAQRGWGRAAAPRDHRIHPPPRASAVRAGGPGERARLASPTPLGIRTKCNEAARGLVLGDVARTIATNL